MLTAHQVLYGYSLGVFPMADPSLDNEIFWYEPKKRGVIFVKDFHVSKSLRLLYQKNKFQYKINTAFEETMKACSKREETWISEEIIDAYVGLYEFGLGFSFEVWDKDEMVGGLYGIKNGHIFHGESMFHKVTNCSKLAMVFLMEWCIKNNIELIDCQFITEHLKQFGAKEITQKAYLKQLQKINQSPEIYF